MVKRRIISKRTSMTGDMISTGVTNLVGVSLVGATAGAVNALPAGTAKTVAGIVPGLQSTALLGPNLKLVKKSLSNGKKKSGYW